MRPETLATTVPMHGLGGRSDLPAPMWLVAYAGAVVVLMTFFALVALWDRPRLETDRGVALPGLSYACRSRTMQVIARLFGLSLLVVFLLAAWLGQDDDGRSNPAPTWFYVWFWVGLVPVSLLLGPIWRAINPLRTILGGISRLVPIGRSPLPGGLGHWPAAVSLVAFLWLELVYDQSASPRAIAFFVTVYVIVHVACGVAFGPGWFSRADGFEVYASMIARASPFYWSRDGRVMCRNPLSGLATTPRLPDLTPVVLVVLGSTVFDGISRTMWWADQIAGTSRAAYLWLGTVGLVGAIGLVAGTYLAATKLTRSLVGLDRDPRDRFAHTIIPIAIGYTIAHYFSFALFQGQKGILLAGDPLGLGWNLFGLDGASVSYTLVSTTMIAVIQVGSIVVGHVVGVVLAHDAALTLSSGVRSVRGQFPMTVVMVVYTTAGIVLLAGA